MLSTFCPLCGNYLEICICGDNLDEVEENQIIKVTSEIRKYSKVTLVLKTPKNMVKEEKNSLLRSLMKGLNTGGTIKNGQLEVRTSNFEKLESICKSHGFKVKKT